MCDRNVCMYQPLNKQSSIVTVHLYILALALCVQYHCVWNCIISPLTQEGKVAIKSVANLLLCIYASGNVGLGLLKAKVIMTSSLWLHVLLVIIVQADALSKHLEAPLLQISTT